MKLDKAFTLCLLITALFSLTSCPKPLVVDEDEINSREVPISKQKVFAQFPKTRSLGIKWVKNRAVPNEPTSDIMPILPATLPGNVNVSDPCVIKVADNDYRMWMTILIKANNPGQDDRYAIGYQKSPDGITWTDLSGDIDTVKNVPSWVETGLTNLKVCSVIETDDNTHKYRMYYLGKATSINNGQWTLYYASANSLYPDPADPSSDVEVKWKVNKFASLQKALIPTAKMFDEDDLSRATVIKDNNEYRMWYGGYSKNVGRIGYASSFGGKTKWKKSDIVIAPGFAASSSYNFDYQHVDNPYVLKDNDVYLMWYSGYNLPWAIGLAYSLDGNRFSFYDDQFESPLNEPVLRPETGWEGRGIMSCCVIKDSDGQGNRVYKMWYTAQGNDKKYRIGYAESRRDEGEANN